MSFRNEPNKHEQIFLISGKLLNKLSQVFKDLCGRKETGKRNKWSVLNMELETFILCENYPQTVSAEFGRSERYAAVAGSAISKGHKQLAQFIFT